jgi:hypothetical protein
MALMPFSKKEGAPGEKKGLLGLGGGGAKKSASAGPDISHLVEDVNSMNRRLRVLEERHSNFRKRMQIIEQNMILSNKKILKEVKMQTSEMSDIRHTMVEIENRLIMVIKELRLTAKKEELEVIDKYLEYWEPVKFVTAEQVEQIIDEKLAEKQ